MQGARVLLCILRRYSCRHQRPRLPVQSVQHVATNSGTARVFLWAVPFRQFRKRGATPSFPCASSTYEKKSEILIVLKSNNTDSR